MAWAEFAWVASDTLVAVVDGSGLVMAIGPGKVEITATAGGVVGRAALVVVAPAPAAVAVTPEAVALAVLGDTVRLMAEVRDQAGRPMEGVPVAWTSGDTLVATVDSTGLVTAAGKGTATITATAGSASGTAVVRALESAGSVVMSPSADTIAPGDTLRLTAEAFDENGRVVAEAVFMWSSNDAAVATVDGTGLVRGIGEGTATITATSRTAQGSAAVTVVNPNRAALVALYHATNGPRWTNNRNWLTDAPLGQWHGVWADGEGRVTRLFLGSNNLTGPIPPELGNLASLEVLWLQRNGLTGPIPPELGNLANLRDLFLSGNGLSGAIPPELGKLDKLEDLWLGGNELSGPIPPELGSLANLQILALGPNELSGPIPPELARLANLERLIVWGTNVTGAIPPELGDLSRLWKLYLPVNKLSGTIPPELGDLANLTELELGGNELSGSIPPELGNLASLERLALYGNDLTGQIPAELGDLGNLESLVLNNNGLSGPIPPEFGNLASLTYLGLGGNAVTGGLPPQLGGLATLEALVLENNLLTGPVPPEFGGISSLQELSLTNNSGMAGPLPSDLTALGRLETLLAGDTGLCASADPGIQAWLARVHKRRIKPCAEGDPPMAYLTQAVQSREYPVPLVAGEKALLRVFAMARQATSEGIPLVRARFYVNGRETHVVDIPGKSTPIPVEVDESSLSKSANAEIPADVIRPGLEMVIDVDPEGTLDSALGVANRIPETGRLAVDVRAMPLFDLTLIPFVWSQTQDSSIVDLIQAMAADPENHEMLEETRTLLPVGDLTVTEHEPVLSSSNNAFDLRANAQAIRAMEGRTGHYMGLMPSPVTGAAGVAFIATRVSFSIPFPTTIAHELGHNMSLYHAPCGGAGGPDLSYPYPDGSIGTWGYDFRDGGSLVHPRAGRDLMTYCSPRWISDYSFTNALRYRLFDEGPPEATIAASSKSLLLWGGISADSVPFLEPAFVVDAAAALPDSAGEYLVTGRTTGGDELFSLSFTMPEVADGDGSSSFAFVLPALPGWEGNLASITLDGPGGSFTLDGDSDLTMAILRNPRTRQVRGILRDLPQADAAAALAPQAGPDSLDVLFSRGIPDAAAWSR